jgi:hypothetical protein
MVARPSMGQYVLLRWLFRAVDFGVTYWIVSGC